MTEKADIPASGDTPLDWTHVTPADDDDDYDESNDLTAGDGQFGQNDVHAPSQNSHSAADSARQALDALSQPRDQKNGTLGNGVSEVPTAQSAHDLVHFSNGHASTSNIANDSAYASAPSSTDNSPGKHGHAILMASRKQNSACDACRSRKVRCNRSPGETKCNHCKAKNIDCTTLYVQWATSSAKRPTKRARTSLVVSEEQQEAPKAPDAIDADVQVQDRLLNYLFQRDSDYVSPTTNVYFYASIPFTTPPVGTHSGRMIIPPSYHSGPKQAATTNAELALLNRQRRDDFVSDLVETYFSVVHARLPVLNPQSFKKRYYERTRDVGGPPSDITLAIIIAWGAKFSENPLIAADRSESAAELQKAYAQAQAALAKGETEKAAQISGIKGGIDQPILTVPAEARINGCNRLADDLMWRAQDILDRLKVSRVATLENIQACLVAEPLLLQPSVLFNGNLNLCGHLTYSKHHSPLNYTNGHWYVIAIKHLLDLGINQRERVMAIKDSGLRGEIMFAWWLACFSDAASSMLFQRRCFISSQDYNSNPPMGNNASRAATNNPLSSPDSYMSYYGSLYDLVIIQRKFASTKWNPSVPIEGIRIEEAEAVMEMLKQWKVDHLEKVGVPLPHWPPHWDYIAAVSACTSDINYHSIWCVLWRALDEFGIYGTDRKDATSPIYQDRLKRKEASPTGPWSADAPDAARVQRVLEMVEKEALDGALRIAGLTEILRSNHYLRLDPCICLPNLEMAALLLIRFQRAEADIMVAGFRQFALSYQDCFEKADILERLAAAYIERGRVDPNFTPGSALGLALEREAAAAHVDQNGIPELAIAAAALSNAAASASDPTNAYTYNGSSTVSGISASESADTKETNGFRPHSYGNSDMTNQGSVYDDFKSHIHGNGNRTQQTYATESFESPDHD